MAGNKKKYLKKACGAKTATFGEATNHDDVGCSGATRLCAWAMSPAPLSVNSSSRGDESREKFTGRKRKRPIGGLKASGAAFQLVALLQLRLQPASTLQGLPRSYLMKT